MRRTRRTSSLSDVTTIPSAAGVALAGKLRMFLAGFVRGNVMTVYCGAEAMATHQAGRP